MNERKYIERCHSTRIRKSIEKNKHNIIYFCIIKKKIDLFHFTKVFIIIACCVFIFVLVREVTWFFFSFCRTYSWARLKKAENAPDHFRFGSNFAYRILKFKRSTFARFFQISWVSINWFVFHQLCDLFEGKSWGTPSIE